MDCIVNQILQPARWIVADSRFENQWLEDRKWFKIYLLQNKNKNKKFGWLIAMPTLPISSHWTRFLWWVQQSLWHSYYVTGLKQASSHGHDPKFYNPHLIEQYSVSLTYSEPKFPWPKEHESKPFFVYFHFLFFFDCWCILMVIIYFVVAPANVIVPILEHLKNHLIALYLIAWIVWYKIIKQWTAHVPKSNELVG